jgi:hypothetical protein
MAKRTVMTPGGEVWHVRRLWAPRLQQERLWTRLRRRMGRTGRAAADGLSGAPDIGFLDLFDDAFAVIGLVIAAVIVVVVLAFVVVPLLVALLDLLVVVVVSLAGLAGRVMFRRPWVVEAADSNGHRYTWRIVGRRESRAAVDAIAAAFAHGHTPPPAAGAVPWLPPSPTAGPAFPEV